MVKDWVAQVGEISSNVQELYAALYAKNPCIVANAWGTHLYCASAGWGRVWTLIYLLLGCFLKDDFKQRKVYEAATRLDGLFRQTLSHIQQYAETLSKHIDHLANEYLDERVESKKERAAIKTWYCKVMPFLELIRDPDQDLKLKALFHKYAPHLRDRSFFQCAIYEELNQLTEVIQLECALCSPLPYAALDRLASHRKLENEEELSRWITKLNKNSPKIGVNLLHRALWACVELRKRHHQEGRCDLSRLEYELSKRGLRLLEEVDPQHLQWVNGLSAEGSRLKHEGISYELTVRREGIHINGSQFILYDVKGNSDQSLLFGVNQAAVPVVKQMSAMKTKEEISITFYSMDPKGRFALVNRFLPLKERPWATAPNSPVPAKEDQYILDQLVHWISWWLLQNPPPKGLSPEAVMLDSRGYLRYSQPLDKPELNSPYSTVEEFLYAISQKNEAIYRYLWKNGKFHAPKLNLDRFYRRMMKHADENLAVESCREAPIFGICDPGIVTRGEQFYYAVKQLRQECCYAILKQKKVGNFAKLKAVVSQCLFECHKEWGEAPFIWQSELLKNQLIQRVIQRI